MSSSPFVSILMTSYNREKYIEEAISSVLTQTYTNFELIIVDDCSIDNTVLIANKFAQKDHRISIFVNETNLGDYNNRNKAASLASGDFLIYVDSDDTIKIDALDYIIDTFDRFPNANHSAIYQHGDIFEPTLVDSENLLRIHLIHGKPVLSGGPGSRVFKRIFFETLGGFPTCYGVANDSYFNILSTVSSSLLLLPYDYLFYRRHEGQEINNEFSYLTNGYLYLKDLLNNIDLPLTITELNFIKIKNDRRFISNLLKYFIKTRSLKKSLNVIRLTNFGFRNLIQGIFY